MSLFRLAIVLSCGVALMPSDKEQQQELYARAASAAYWTATFCDRNEKTCETAGALWDTFITKAEFAGRLGYDLAQHYYVKGSEPQPASFAKPAEATQGAPKLEKISAPVAAPSAEASEPPSSTSKGTLRSEDLAPAWRGKQQGGA